MRAMSIIFIAVFYAFSSRADSLNLVPGIYRGAPTSERHSRLFEVKVDSSRFSNHMQISATWDEGGAPQNFKFFINTANGEGLIVPEDAKDLTDPRIEKLVTLLENNEGMESTNAVFLYYRTKGLLRRYFIQIVVNAQSGQVSKLAVENNPSVAAKIFLRPFSFGAIPGDRMLICGQLLTE
jgi:hypothetical protein